MPVVAQLFFVLFSLTIMFTTLEMFVNIVLQSFENLTNAAGLPITLSDIASFANVWKCHDPLAEGWIDFAQIDALIAALPPRLGIDRLAGDNAIDRSHLRLIELPGGEFSRHLLGDSIHEVESANTRAGQELRIQRIVAHCYGEHPGSLTCTQLFGRLAEFGVSMAEVEAMVMKLASTSDDSNSKEAGTTVADRVCSTFVHVLYVCIILYICAHINLY
jgi:hypothetical protein